MVTRRRCEKHRGIENVSPNPVKTLGWHCKSRKASFDLLDISSWCIWLEGKWFYENLPEDAWPGSADLKGPLQILDAKLTQSKIWQVQFRYVPHDVYTGNDNVELTP